ncbi:hypothetical protein [Caballeronia sp. GAOx1]|uniref:hypothetical protein n=1 Tax=Caballeronia sp. GAOx1 TaxID=2921761 RepID=UPI00202816D1
MASTQDGPEVDFDVRSFLQPFCRPQESYQRLATLLGIDTARTCRLINMWCWVSPTPDAGCRPMCSKRMDDVEAQRCTERLGLPEGWLDTPRSDTDIPESVVLLLAPASRARGQSLALPASAAAPNHDTLDAAAPASQSDVVLSSTPSDAHAAASPTDAPGGQGGVIGREENELNEAVAAPADERVDADESKVPDAVARPAESPLAPAAPPRTAAPAISTLQTRLDGLDGIAPIAEALLKTLAGKARTGRLDEMKALELLQQAVLL